MKARLFLALVPILVMACGRHDDPPAPEAAPQPSQSQSASTPSACQITREKYEAMKLTPEDRIVILHLEKQRQRVVRLDCKGQVKSDGIEVVQAPVKKTHLKPATPLEAPAHSVQLFNADNCAASGQQLPTWDVPLFGQLSAVTGGKDGAIDVKFDASPAVFTFHLNDGLNRVYFTYYKNCSPSSVDCKDPGPLLSGLFLVHMTYTEKTLDGMQTLQEQSCTDTNPASAK